MKILITNPNKVRNIKPCVTSAVAELFHCGQQAQMKVLINTTERWMPIHRQGHCLDVQADATTGTTPVHQFFLVGSGKNKQTGVPLIAENDEEKSLLGLRTWVDVEKDQIAILFMSHGSFVKTLGEFGP